MGTMQEALMGLGFVYLQPGEEERVCVDIKPVPEGTSLTYDTNNGVLVVYDDTRRPWVRRDNLNAEHQTAFNKLALMTPLKRGAYVPHSNDGGKRMQVLFPRHSKLS